MSSQMPSVVGPRNVVVGAREAGVVIGPRSVAGVRSNDRAVVPRAGVADPDVGRASARDADARHEQPKHISF